MASMTKRVTDPVFEEIMRYSGPKVLYIERRFPKKFSEYLRESESINSRAALAAESCASLVLDYTLLEHSEEFFEALRSTYRTFDNFYDSVINDPKYEQGARERAQKSKQDLPRKLGDRIESLRDKKEKLEIVHRGQESSAYVRSMVSKGVSKLKTATAGLGRYGRIEAYSHVVLSLDKETRKLHPESGFFIDLMIKGIFLSEPELKARKSIWLNSDMRNRELLRRSDVLMPAR